MSAPQPFPEELRRTIHSSGVVPEPVAVWLEKVDEEIAVVTRLLAIRLSEKQQYKTEETLASVAVPLGYVRSFHELIDELQRCGIVQKSFEEVKGDASEDAARNPSLELGRIFYWIRRYLRESGLLDLESLPYWYPKI